VYKAFIDPISAIQGGHHVAQKFIKITFPLRSAVERILLLLSVNENEARACELPVSFLALALKIPVFISPCRNNAFAAGTNSNTSINAMRKKENKFFLR
jgi:hypothetical protein